MVAKFHFMCTLNVTLDSKRIYINICNFNELRLRLHDLLWFKQVTGIDEKLNVYSVVVARITFGTGTLTHATQR